jgi:hypothetical protein
VPPYETPITDAFYIPVVIAHCYPSQALWHC